MESEDLLMREKRDRHRVTGSVGRVQSSVYHWYSFVRMSEIASPDTQQLRLPAAASLLRVAMEQGITLHCVATVKE